MSNQRERVASGTVASALTMTIGFIAIVPFSRSLGPSDIGLYFWVLSIISTADGVINGLLVAIKKRVSEVDADIPELLGVIAWIVVPFTVLVAAVVSVGLLVSGAAQPWTAAAAFIIFVPFVLAVAAKRVIIGLERVDVAQWLTTGRTCLRVVLQFGLLVIGTGVAGMFAGYATAMIAATVVGFMIVGVRPTAPSRETLQSVWQFARYSVPSGFVSRLDESIDQVLVGFLFLSSAVGNYGVAVRLVAPALLLTGVLQGSLSARLSRLESKEEPVDQPIKDNLAFTGVIAIPLFFGAAAIPKHTIITVFSSQYGEAAPLLVALAGTRVVKSYTSPMTSAVAGLNRPRALLWINTVSSAVMVAAAVAFGVVMGPIGVVFGLLTSLCVRLVACVVVLSDYVALSALASSEILRQVASGLVMFIIVEILDIVYISGWISILITIGLGVIVYAMTLFIISAKTRIHVRELTNYINIGHAKQFL